MTEALPLNVCLLNDNFPPSIDGVSMCVKNYAHYIESAHGHATVCTPRYPNAHDDYPFRVLRYPSLPLSREFGYRMGLPFNRRIIRQLADTPFDILHAHCPIMSMLLGRTLRELDARPLVLTYHSKYDQDIDNEVRSSCLREEARRAILSNIQAADAVWTVSHGAADSMRRLGYDGPYTVMRNGVDLPRGGADERAVRAVNEQLGISPSMPLFLFIGRMMWYKGIRMILDGIAALKAERIPFRMLFVGSGQDQNAILRYAHDLGLDDVCIFLPTETDREKLRAYYTRGDFFLFPSDYDTNGLVVREAAACGTASMTLRGSCAAEDITEDVNGVTVTSAEDVARFCRQIALDPKRAAQMGERALSDLYLSWEDSVAIACRSYQEVIDRVKREGRPRRALKLDRTIRSAARLYRATGVRSKKQQPTAEEVTP